MVAATDFEAYLRAPYTRILVPDETGGYVAEILEFPGCFSQGETPDEAMANLDDAMVAWLSALKETGRPVPEPLELHGYSGRIVLRLPKALHREAARRAELNGVSLNQWMVEAIAERMGAEGFAQRLANQVAARLRMEATVVARTVVEFDNVPHEAGLKLVQPPQLLSAPEGWLRAPAFTERTKEKQDA